MLFAAHKTSKGPALPAGGRQAGFTLIELMVAIGIVAILATIGLVMYSNAQRSARDSKRIGDIQEIQKGLEQYYSANNSFPLQSGSTIANTNSFYNYFQSSKVSTDSMDGQTKSGAVSYGYKYFYKGVSCTSEKYVLCAALENCGSQCNRGVLPSTGCDTPTDSGAGTPPVFNYYCVGSLSN